MEYIVISSDSSSEYSNSDDDLYTAINYNGDIDSHVRAGNPLQPCPFKRKYFQSVRRRRKKMSIASAVEENDEDFDQFDLQKAISNSLQKVTNSKGMCTSQRNGDKSDRNRGSSSKSDKRHNRTWCQERSERQALVSSQLQKYASPLKITSGEDSDELPDLDTKPDTSSDVLNSKMTEGCGKTLCKERHFTDSLSFNPEMSFLGSCSMELKSEPIENIECKAGNIFKRRRSDRMSQEMQAGSAPVESEELVVIRFPELTSLNTNEKPKRLISDYFKTEPSESLDLDTIERKKFKNWRVKFLRGLPCFQADVMSEVCREFSSMQILMVESIAEDQNDATYFTHMLNLLQDFSVTHKPPLHLVDNVIRCGLVEPNDHKLAFQAYACVRNIWQRFPDLISFDWTTTQIAGDIIKRKLQAHGAHVAKREAKSSFEPQSRLEEQFKDEPTFQQAALYLQLQVFGLQRNLSSCVLADPKSVRMSLAYKNLSAINPVVKIKRLIYWLECCLIAVEHNYVPEQVFISNMENNNDSHDALQTKKDPERGSSRKDTDEHTEKGAPLLPSVTDVGSWLLVSLQDLLSMSILVSRDHHEAARNLASELRHTYIYLPNLRLKKQLLQTVSCPLLCYHLVRLVLENHCNNTIFNSSFPASARELANSYFPALPPKSPMTPPPSPSDEEDAPSDGHAHTYSMQSCEELAMLMFFITKSFVACRQKRLNQDLRQQILLGPDLPSLKEEERIELQVHVSDFEKHLLDLVPELNAATKMYLLLMETLGTAM